MMKIEVLGPGCSRCDETYEKVKQALNELNVEAEVTKVTDVFKIIDRGIDFTPALVIVGKVVSQGKVPKKEEIKKILEDQISAQGKLE